MPDEPAIEEVGGKQTISTSSSQTTSTRDTDKLSLDGKRTQFLFYWLAFYVILLMVAAKTGMPEQVITVISGLASGIALAAFAIMKSENPK